MAQVVVTHGNKRTAYWIEDKAAEPYLTFLRKASRGVSIQDAAEQTIGPVSGITSIAFHTGGNIFEQHHYILRIKDGVVLDETLRRGRTTLIARQSEHTTIHNAAPRDYPTSHAALAAIAWFDKDSREFREVLFDC